MPINNKIVLLLLLGIVSICAYVGVTAHEGRDPAPDIAAAAAPDPDCDTEGSASGKEDAPEKPIAPWLLPKQDQHPSSHHMAPPPIKEARGLLESLPKPVSAASPLRQVSHSSSVEPSLPAMEDPPAANDEAPPPAFPPVEDKKPAKDAPAPPVPTPPVPVQEVKKVTPVPAPEKDVPLPIPPKAETPSTGTTEVPAPAAPPVSAMPVPPTAPAPASAPVVSPDVPAPVVPKVDEPPPPVPPSPVPPSPVPPLPTPVTPEQMPMAPTPPQVPVGPKIDAVPPKASPEVPAPAVPNAEAPVTPAPVAPPMVPPPAVPKKETPAPVVPTQQPPAGAEVPVAEPPLPPIPPVPPTVPLQEKLPAIPQVTIPPRPESPQGNPGEPSAPTIPKFVRPGISAGTPVPMEGKKTSDSSQPAVVIPPMSTQLMSSPETGPSLAPMDNLPKRPPAFRLVNPLRRQDGPGPIPLPFDERHLIFPGATPTVPSIVQPSKEPEPSPKNVSPPPTIRAPEPLPLNSAQEETPMPPVSVEKTGPMTMKAGEVLKYEILIRNTGSAAAHQVRVEDELLPGTRFLKGDPLPTLEQGKLVWTVGLLPPGGEKRFRLELKALISGPGTGATTVMVTAPAPAPAARTVPQAARADSSDNLAVKIVGPAQANMGQKVHFEIEIANNGARAVNDLVLHVALPAGLKHGVAQNIEGDVGTLAAGARRTVRVITTGVQEGRHIVQAKVTASNAQDAVEQASVSIGAGGLQINQNPTHRLILEKPNEIRIEIINHQSQTLRKISVIDTLPGEVDFLTASDRGIYRPGNRAVSWLIEQLEPGQSKVLVVQVRPKKIGQWHSEVVARAAPNLETRSRSIFFVEGFPDLNVKIVGRDTQLEVGKETVYQIRVVNEGTVPATNIQVAAFLPEGMQAGHAQGPTTFQGQGRQIQFAPLISLNPRGQAVFHVGVLAQAPGDRRFRVQVTSDQSQLPISREERTLVYRD